MTRRTLANLLLALSVVLSACTAAPSTASGGLTALDLTATAQAASHSSPTDLDLTATAGAGHSASGPSDLDLTATAGAGAGTGTQGGGATAVPPEQRQISADPWTMFKHDAKHTGLAEGTGAIDPASGPRVRWAYQLLDASGTPQMRWASGLPLGDLDGDGRLEIVIASYDGKVYALGGD